MVHVFYGKYIYIYKIPLSWRQIDCVHIGVKVKK